jgi:hypothetical protein
MDDRADAETLRRGVRERYRDVALNPDGAGGLIEDPVSP